MAHRSLPGETYARLRTLTTEIDRLDQAAADRFGVNRTDMRALDVLGNGPLAPSALSQRLGITTGGLTSVLDRLEKAGYVRRRNDPHDRRRQVVESTEATAAREREVFQGLIGATTRFLSSYTDEQLRVINDFLMRMGQLTAEYAETLTDQPPAAPGPSPARRSRG
jgi:DNA-binding MarR family transcriptional regulator